MTTDDTTPDPTVDDDESLSGSDVDMTAPAGADPDGAPSEGASPDAVDADEPVVDGADADEPGVDGADADEPGVEGADADEPGVDGADADEPVVDEDATAAASTDELAADADPGDGELADEPLADEGPTGPPTTAVVLSIIAVLAVVAGLGFAFVTSRTPATYSIDGESVSREEAAATLDELQPGVGDIILDAEDATAEELQQARELLNFEIVYALLTRAADERGVEVTEAQILESVRERFAEDAPDDEVLAAAAAATGATEERLRRESEANLIYEGLVASADLPEPTDAEIEAAYESGEFADLSSPGLNIITAQTQEEADEAFERLESGEEFGAVAASLDPAYSGPQRGFDPSFLPPQLQEPVSELEDGEYTEPIELEEGVGEGFVILQTVAPPELEEVSATIAEALASQAEGEFLQELLTETEEASDIVVDPIFGEWVNGQGLVPPEAQALGAPALPGGDDQ